MDILIYGFSAIGIIIGLTQITKGFGLDSKYAPIASLVFGVGLGLLGNPTGTLMGNIVSGIVLGLAGCGIWSGTKATVLGQ